MIRRLVVGEALFEGDRQKLIAQFHRAGGEDARVHQDRWLRHQRLEIHFAENVFLRSTPGAISVSSSPSLVNRNTQRSVMYSTDLPDFRATCPLNVTCSTLFTNFRMWPSRTIWNAPS